MLKDRGQAEEKKRLEQTAHLHSDIVMDNRKTDNGGSGEESGDDLAHRPRYRLPRVRGRPHMPVSLSARKKHPQLLILSMGDADHPPKRRRLDSGHGLASGKPPARDVDASSSSDELAAASDHEPDRRRVSWSLHKALPSTRKYTRSPSPSDSGSPDELAVDADTYWRESMRARNVNPNPKPRTSTKVTTPNPTTTRAAARAPSQESSGGRSVSDQSPKEQSPRRSYDGQAEEDDDDEEEEAEADEADGEGEGEEQEEQEEVEDANVDADNHDRSNDDSSRHAEEEVQDTQQQQEVQRPEEQVQQQEVQPQEVQQVQEVDEKPRENGSAPDPDRSERTPTPQPPPPPPKPERLNYKLRSVLKGHLRGVSQVKFSPDGRMIASGGEDCNSISISGILVLIRNRCRLRGQGLGHAHRQAHPYLRGPPGRHLDRGLEPGRRDHRLGLRRQVHPPVERLDRMSSARRWIVRILIRCREKHTPSPSSATTTTSTPSPSRPRATCSSAARTTRPSSSGTCAPRA